MLSGRGIIIVARSFDGFLSSASTDVLTTIMKKKKVELDTRVNKKINSILYANESLVSHKIIMYKF